MSVQDLVRLCALSYLHDLGKANRGFWARQFPGARVVGHTNETAALFFSDLAASIAVRPLVDFLLDWQCWDLFVAVMAHHGRPLEAYASAGVDAQRRVREERWPRAYWQAEGGYDPLAELTRLLDDVRTRFPLAFAPGPPMPDAPPFVALAGGLVTLADWLGSDRLLFPVAGPHLTARDPLRAKSATEAIAGRGLAQFTVDRPDFAALFGFAPLGAQLESDDLSLGAIALIEAETGSGKTEAALWRWLGLRAAGEVDGLYFALPTRSAAVQLHGRVNRMLRALTGGAVQAVLAVPGYIRAGESDGERARGEDGALLPGFDVVWPDRGENDTEGRWAAEQPKRYLAARVAVGTVDQALMSGLQLRHAHFRGAMLARSLLVVDEVHSSDHFMGETLRAVLRNHVTMGGRALLLSATLTAQMRARLLDPFAAAPRFPALADAEAISYPALSGCAAPVRQVERSGQRDKCVRLSALPLIDEAGDIAARAVAAARQGASVLVVRNSVAGAVGVARAVEELAPELAFTVNGVATLHHGRFAADDRRLLDTAVEAAFGKGRSAQGRVLVGTQTLEQSLDLDADLLLTDLAPIDVLLQRIGRLHRHHRQDRGSFAAAEAMILVPAERNLSRYFRRMGHRHGLGPNDDGRGVYPDLLAIEATWRLIVANPAISIPRDNRRLVEQALHPDRAQALQDEMGVDWMNHGAQQSGIAFAERQLAREFALDVRTPFTDLLFPGREETISTRLGGKDRLVRFDPAPDGPFGLPLRQLTIPDWMARGVPADAEVEVTSAEEGIRFTYGSRSLHYGRMGLRAA